MSSLAGQGEVAPVDPLEEVPRQVLSSSVEFICTVYEEALSFVYDADWGQWDATLWYAEVSPIIERHLMWLVHHAAQRNHLA